MRKINHALTSLLASALVATTLCSTNLIAQSDEARTEPIGSLKGETFRPRSNADGIIDVESARVGDQKDFGVSMWSWYAQNPLVLTDRDDVTNRINSLISDRVGLSLLGHYTFTDWFDLAIEVPVIVFQDGDTEVASITPSQNIYDITAFGLGEVRLMPKFRFRDGGQHGIHVSGLLNWWLPTETESDQYFGGDGMSVRPAVSLSQRLSSGFQWGMNGGLTLRDPYRSGNVDVGQSVDLRVGARYFFGPQAEPKTAVSASARTDIQFYPDLLSATTRFENALEGNIAFEWFASPNWTLLAGAGGGFIPAPGVPDFRAFLSVAFDKSGCVDTDKDGICDVRDQCINEAEDKDDFEDADGCPDPDNDGDQVLDADDKCDDSAEDFDGFEDTDGCLDEDNDKDGILDTDDQCPNEPGVEKRRGCPIVDRDEDGVLDVDDKCPDVPGVPAQQGCPEPDTDGDGVIDKEDKCPELKGPAHFYGCPDSDGDGFPDPDDMCPERPEVINGIRDNDGCPDKGQTLVKLTKEKIEIKKSVYFATGKSRIKKVSYNLLDQVAAILDVHSEILEVRVEGHTDSVGRESTNLKLSDDRAQAVRQYLIDKGIAETRLTAVGFGEAKPIASNKTKTGRSQNRRVEFVIVKTQDVPNTKKVELKAAVAIKDGRLSYESDIEFEGDEVSTENMRLLDDIADFMKANPSQGPFQLKYRVTDKNKYDVSRKSADARLKALVKVLENLGVPSKSLTVLPLKLSNTNPEDFGVRMYVTGVTPN